MGDWTAYCVWNPTEWGAAKKLSLYVQAVEEYNPEKIECEMWNTFQHGNINDYEVLS
jgi:hypothetical protein